VPSANLTGATGDKFVNITKQVKMAPQLSLGNGKAILNAPMVRKFQNGEPSCSGVVR